MRKAPEVVRAEPIAEKGNARDVYNPLSVIPYLEFFVNGERKGGRHITRDEEKDIVKKFVQKYDGEKLKIICNDPAKPFGYAWYELAWKGINK